MCPIFRECFYKKAVPMDGNKLPAVRLSDEYYIQVIHVIVYLFSSVFQKMVNKNKVTGRN